MTPRLWMTACCALISGFAWIGVAMAQDASPGRYTMHPTNDGLVRLDTQTGAVSLCRKAGDNWSCEPMNDTAKARRDELAQLRRENSALKTEVKRLEEMLGLNDRSSGTRTPREKAPGLTLPSEKQVDEALNYFERLIQKFQERLERLEKKPSEPPAEERRL
ncbi:MAG: hypothetical protein AAGC70_08230 [Pseudomonadota bacterium]